MIILAALLAATAPVAIPFDAAARAGLAPASAVLAVHGGHTTCEGVWLGDLIAKAGIPTGEAVKGPALAMIIIADAADGYRVVFSLGEIDAKLGKTPVLVADRCDGKPLDAATGPLRLVVPGDARGARSVRQLARLQAQAVAP